MESDNGDARGFEEDSSHDNPESAVNYDLNLESEEEYPRIYNPPCNHEPRRCCWIFTNFFCL